VAVGLTCLVVATGSLYKLAKSRTTQVLGRLVGLPWFLWRAGRTSVTWDVEPDSYAGVSTSAERIATHVLEPTRPGSIILLHVWYPGNAPARAAPPEGRPDSTSQRR
jgi:hypothetical protein